MKDQGEYTTEDYFSLPEGKRAELIAGQIFVQLNSFLRKKKASCVPCIAPVDVQLDCDDRTMVQQNVLVYDLKNMEFPSIYGFDAKIPVTIFGGECKINMRDIQEYMENVCGLG